MSCSWPIVSTHSSKVSMLQNTYRVCGFRCCLIANSSTTCQFLVQRSLLKTQSVLSFTIRSMICSVLTWKVTLSISRTMVAMYRTSLATTGISLSTHVMSSNNTLVLQIANLMLRCVSKWTNSLWRQRQAHSSSPRRLTSTTIIRLMFSSQQRDLSSQKVLQCTITTLYKKSLMY